MSAGSRQRTILDYSTGQEYMKVGLEAGILRSSTAMCLLPQDRKYFYPQKVFSD